MLWRSFWKIGTKFPIETAAMIQAEYSCGASRNLAGHPCFSSKPAFDGPCAVACSVAFASSQHVDMCDGSIRIFTWFTKAKKCVKQGYLA